MFFSTVFRWIVLLLYLDYDVSCVSDSQWSFYIKEESYDTHLWAVRELPNVVKLIKVENNSYVIEYPDTQYFIELKLAHAVLPQYSYPKLNETLVNVAQDATEETFVFRWYEHGKEKIISKRRNWVSRSYSNFILIRDSTEIVASLDLRIKFVEHRFLNRTLQREKSKYTLLTQEHSNVTCFRNVCDNKDKFNIPLKTKSECRETVPCEDSLLANKKSDYTEICTTQPNGKLECLKITLSEDFYKMKDSFDLNKTITYKSEDNKTFIKKPNTTEAFILKYGDTMKSIRFVSCNVSILDDKKQDSLKNGAKDCLKIVPYLELSDDLLKTIFDSVGFTENLLNTTVQLNGTEFLIQKCKTEQRIDRKIYKETTICFKLKKNTWTEQYHRTRHIKKISKVIEKQYKFNFRLKYIGVKNDKEKSKKSYFSKQDINVIVFISVIILLGVLCHGVKRCWFKPKARSDCDPASNIALSSESTLTSRFKELPNIRRAENELSSGTSDGLPKIA